MRILLVHNSYQRPGGEDVVFDQERQMLEHAGHTITAFYRSNWEADTYSGFRRIGLAQNAIWSNDTRKEFSSLLLKEKPQLVHIHNTFVMISPSIYSACGEAGVPVVQTLHNYRLLCPAATFFRDGKPCEECLEHSLSRSVLHGCYRDSRATTSVMALTLAVHRRLQTWTKNVTCYIALSEFSRRKFVRGGLPGEKIFVKPNFVHPDPGPRTHGDGDYALFVGRLSPEKRVSTLLAAWSRLVSSIPLVIVGGGPERWQLEAEATRSNLGLVSFRGHQSRQETLATLRGARFLIFSSEWYENFPLTIIESFASGVPVICSRLGAMQEIVDDGRTGLYFVPGDAADLAEKVEWAWNHPAHMQSMGEEARREYEAKYTTEKNYPVLMHIYESAIGKADPMWRTTPLYADGNRTIDIDQSSCARASTSQT